MEKILNQDVKLIKWQLRNECQYCKFSVSMRQSLIGQSLYISLIKSSFKVIQDLNDIPETKEKIKELDQYQFNKKEWDKNICNNGVFLTQQGYNLFRRVLEIVNKYTGDQIVNLSIGTRNKPYEFINKKNKKN